MSSGNFFEKGGFKRIKGKEKYYTGAFPQEYLCSKDDLIVAMTQQAEGLLGSTALVPEDNLYLHNQRIGGERQLLLFDVLIADCHAEIVHGFSGVEGVNDKGHIIFAEYYIPDVLAAHHLLHG